MPIVRLTRAVTFRAAHRYHRPEWSAAENAARFGACADEHEHAYACHVTVAGPPDPATSMVMDLAAFDRLLEAEITAPLGGRRLHRDVSEFGGGGALPTTEALALHIWRRLAARLPEGIRLERVRVYEDSSLYAEYRGE